MEVQYSTISSTYNRPEGVVVLPQDKAHLVVVVVVGLSVGPVEPLDGPVHVVPGPGAGLVLAVPTLEEGEEECWSPRHGRRARTLDSQKPAGWHPAGGTSASS